MTLFTGTAEYYRRYRPVIPPNIAQILDDVAPGRGRRERRLLDLGTGTGQVVRALRGRLSDVIAVDPEAEMQRRAGHALYAEPVRRHGDVLAESPFGRIDERHVPIQRTWTADRIIGHLHSTSFAALPLFGGPDRQARFEAAVRAVLAQFSDCDTFIEDSEFEVFIARRPEP